MNCIRRQPIFPRRIRSDLYSFDSAEQSWPPSTPCVLSVLSSLVERVVRRNDRLSLSNSLTFSPPKYEVFNGVEVPDMSIQHYLERIFRYIHCSPSVFVVAYAYIDRLIQLHPQFKITSHNVHRLLIVTLMVASKFIEDINYKNSYYARVGGFSTDELNRLEMELLFLLGFKLQVTVNVFERYCCQLEREMAMGGGFQIERSLRLSYAKDESSRPNPKSQMGVYCLSSYNHKRNRSKSLIVDGM
ncbi:hypothetical protein SUGI_0643720 [Cryptomeria japonica]|uniref:cyclin-U2-1-like n=1 Tax=Cryptomeria japonica TaxID=3369 RepID=UPI002414BDD7|nr:cyclin-U2-1-like [Cryptomeria japonica]GLJ31982.1 hypothetical protein SUGI_0643720 [Cryptomeria japonica]